jgi:hypothetical protein
MYSHACWRCLQLGFDVRIFVLNTYKVPFDGSTLPLNVTTDDTTDMLSHVQVSLIDDWCSTVIMHSCTRMFITSRLRHQLSCMRPLLPKCAGFWAEVAAIHLRQANSIDRCNSDIIQVCCALVCCALVATMSLAHNISHSHADFVVASSPCHGSLAIAAAGRPACQLLLPMCQIGGLPQLHGMEQGVCCRRLWTALLLTCGQSSSQAAT